MELKENDRLRAAVRYFTEETGLMCGLTAACGDSTRAFFAADGTADGSHRITPETRCDLASATKLFTGLCAFRLAERGLIDFCAPVTRYAPAYSHLGDVTVDQLLGFEVCLTTPGRVDAQPDQAAAREVLREIAPGPFPGTRFYSDMPAIVLGEVLEGASGLRLDALFRREITEPLGMEDTRFAVPEAQRSRCACYDREHRLERGQYILRAGVAPGTAHDPKARILNADGAHPVGHAGLFSTLGDMARLCRGVLAGAVVSAGSLRRMAQNRCGRPLPEGGWTQYLGSMCFVKHPCQHFSEVPVYMSDQAVSMGGFTGNHVSFDPVTGRWAVFLGNRVLNRLSVLLPEPGKTLTDYGLNADGTGSIRWPDGERVASSVDWVHHKDRHLHSVIGELLESKEA